MTQTIWLHGAALNSSTWQPAPAGLCLDLPGHRQAPRTTPTVQAYADAVLAQLPDQCALVGHSLGAMVAMEIAARVPQRCTALVLVDPPLRMPLAVLRRFGPGLARLVSVLPGPRGIAALMALRVERRAGRPMVKQAIGAMTRDGINDAMLAAVGFDGRALLPRLTMPVLAILGKRSVLTGPRTEATLRRDLPRGTVEVWDCGHMIPMDLPDAFFARVATFLDTQQ